MCTTNTGRRPRITEYARDYQDAMREVLEKWADDGAGAALEYARQNYCGEQTRPLNLSAASRRCSALASRPGDARPSMDAAADAAAARIAPVAKDFVHYTITTGVTGDRRGIQSEFGRRIRS